MKRKFDDVTKKTWPQHELELIKNGYTTEWGEDFEDLSGDELHAAQECKARCDALAHVYADERKIATNPDAMFEMTYVHDFRQRFVPPPTFGTRRRPPSPSRRPCPTWPFPYAATAPRRPRSPPLVCSVARADSEAVGKNPYFVGYALRMHAFNVVIQTMNYVELVVKPAFVSTMSGFDGALFWLGRVKDHLAASLFLDQPEPEGNWAHDVEMVRAQPPA